MLTIMIPTKNRSELLIRLLNYYAESGYKYYISILDSSNDTHLEQTQRAIKGLQMKLKISYCQSQVHNDVTGLKYIIESISTPYAVYNADDDFLIVKGIGQSLDFLEANREYSAAHGLAALVMTQKHGSTLSITNVSSYPQPQLEENSAASRILKHFGNYSVTLFSVHRTSTWRKMYVNSSIPDRTFAGELLPCCLSVIYGKVKQLDCLYLMRQVSHSRYALPDIYDWVASPNWYSAYKVFYDCLVAELSAQDGIAMEEARELIKQAFWSYLHKGLKNKFQCSYGHGAPKTLAKLKALIKNMPLANNCLLSAWHLLRSNIFHVDKTSLTALLNPNSPYHSDFMSISRIISNPSEFFKGGGD